MARQRKLLLTPKRALLTGGVILVVAAGVAFVSRDSGHHFSNFPAFPVERYLDSSGLFSQEDFRIDGTVDNVLLRSDGGRQLLVSIKPEDSSLVLPILFESGEKPLQRQQRLVMKVHVSANGEIYCTKYDVR